MNARFPLVAAIAACVAVFFLMVRIQRLEKQLKNTPRAATAGVVAAATPEVADHMARMQVFANKLWSAGKAGNLPLADFYRHELKEQMETIAGAGIIDDGVDVSARMEVYGLRTVEAVKQELKVNGLAGFDQQYAMLVNACNTCHSECGKPFLRVRVPTYTRYDDQEFAPAME